MEKKCEYEDKDKDKKDKVKERASGDSGTARRACQQSEEQDDKEKDKDKDIKDKDKKEHLAILAQLDVPCPKLEENDEKGENEEKFWQKRREIMAEMRKITMKQVISVVNKHLSKSRNKCPWNMKNMLFRPLNFFL